jgi:para-nitrobenzyl esterase
LFTLPKSTLAPEQKTLSDSMIKYWTSFAKSGDPNTQGLPAWPAFAADGSGILSLGTGATGVAPATGFSADHKCDIVAPPMP